MTRVWKGANKSDFEVALSALQRVDIPLRFRERTNFRSAAEASIHNFILPFAREYPISDTEFEITVLERDADRARHAIEEALAKSEDEDE